MNGREAGMKQKDTQKGREHGIRLLAALRRWTVILYLIYMAVFFPLFFDDHYYNIIQAKRAAFVTGTMVFVLVMLAELLLGLLLGRKPLREWLDAQDLLLFLLMVCYLISTVGASDPAEAFFGYLDKGTGSLMYLLGILAILLLKHHFAWNEWVEWAMLVGSGIVFFLQCKSHVSHVLESEVENAHFYISTLGNVNYNASFDCIMLAVIMSYALVTKDLFSKLLCVLVTFAGYMGAICTSSASAYVGIAAVMVILGIYVLYSGKAAYVFYCEVLAFPLACGGVFLLEKICWDWIVRAWGESELMIRPKVFVPLFVVLLLICAFMEFLRRRRLLGKSNRRILGISVGAGALAAIAGLIAKTQHSGLPSLLVFDDAWGSGRGLLFRKCFLLWGQSDWYHKLFGYGNNMVSRSLALISEAYNQSGQLIQDAHSVIINTLVTNGLVGLLLWAALFAVVLAKAFSVVRNRPEAIVSITGLLAFAAQGMLNGPQSITTPVFLVLMGVSAGVLRKN